VAAVGRRRCDASPPTIAPNESRDKQSLAQDKDDHFSGIGIP
jgi:hypothetical protein